MSQRGGRGMEKWRKKFPFKGNEIEKEVFLSSSPSRLRLPAMRKNVCFLTGKCKVAKQEGVCY